MSEKEMKKGTPVTTPKSVHWVIEDTDDGSHRRTKVYRGKADSSSVFTWSSPLQKWKKEAEELLKSGRLMFDLYHSIYLEQPALLVSLVLGEVFRSATRSCKAYLATRTLLWTQDYLTTHELKLYSFCTTAIALLLLVIMKNRVNAAVAPRKEKLDEHLGYNLDARILAAVKNIDVATQVEKNVNLLRRQSEDLRGHQFMGGAILDTITGCCVNVIGLPFLIAASVQNLPTQHKYLVVVMCLNQTLLPLVFSRFERESPKHIHSSAVSQSNPEKIRLQRLVEISKDPQSQDLGISQWLHKEYIETADKLRTANRLSALESESDLDHHASDAQRMAYVDFAHRLCDTVLMVAFVCWARESITVASWANIQVASGSFWMNLYSVRRQIAQLSQQSKNLSALLQLEEIGRASDAQEAAAATLPQINAGGLSFELENVSFSYPDCSNAKLILNGVSLKVQPGSLTCIVGHNAAGKTTLLNLLQRLYDIKEGYIKINGINLKDIKRSEIASCIATVPQLSQLLGLSLAENIALENYRDDEVVSKAAIRSGAAEFVEKLEQSYRTPTQPSLLYERCYNYDLYHTGDPSQTISPNDTVALVENSVPSQHPILPEDLDVQVDKDRKKLNKVVQHNWESPEQYSGGQIQKIILARAFAKSVGAILFDEPAASLDPEAEHNLFEEVQKLRGLHTVLYCTHRWRGVCDRSDQVVFMNEGKIEESGTHEELLKNGKNYARLWKLQTKHGLQEQETTQVTEDVSG